MLQHLELSQVRNLSAMTLELSPSLNLIIGPNGVGKSSILEAIHYLSLGRSFRSRQQAKVISHDADKLQIVAKLFDGSIIGMEKSRDGGTLLRMNGESIGSVAILAKELPLQLIEPHSYQLLEGPPKQRRQFLDWGVFHVEHRFHRQWQASQKALKQRNAALRMGLDTRQVTAWDEELIQSAKVIDEFRAENIQAFLPLFQQVLQELSDFLVTVDYYPGWRRDDGIESVYQASLARDRQLGYTQFGPHRADLKIKTDKRLVIDVFSRGQQKLFICAMQIAQGLMLKQLTGKQSIYLLDDITAEWDPQVCRQVIDFMRKMDAQVVITSVDEHLLDVIAEESAVHVIKLS